MSHDLFPCDPVKCTEYHNDFWKLLKEEGFKPRTQNKEDAISWSNCGRCGIEVCGNHSTAAIIWFDEDATKDNFKEKKHEVKFNPALCKQCMWDADNNGEFGREPGWVATRSTRPEVKI